jgi:hypothetical protein
MSILLEAIQCEQILRSWKEYLHAGHWPDEHETLDLQRVLSQKELMRIKHRSRFRSLFPEERTEVFPLCQREDIIIKLLNNRPFRTFFVLTDDFRGIEIAKPVELEFASLRVRQLWSTPEEPNGERTIWVGLSQIRHIEWADTKTTNVIEFDG